MRVLSKMSQYLEHSSEDLVHPTEQEQQQCYSYGSLGPQQAHKNELCQICHSFLSNSKEATDITCIIQASGIRPKLMLPTVDFECKVADEQLATVVY